MANRECAFDRSGPTSVPNMFLLCRDYSCQGSLSTHSCVLKEFILGRWSSCAFVRADIHPHSFRLNGFSFFSLEVCQHFKLVSQESVWRVTACASLFTKYWSFISFLRGNFVLCSEMRTYWVTPKACPVSRAVEVGEALGKIQKEEHGCRPITSSSAISSQCPENCGGFVT